MAGKAGMKRGPQKPPLDFSAIKVTEVTDPEKMREFRRTRGERTKEQIQTEQLVQAAHKLYVDAGRPEAWEDRHGLHLAVPTAQFDTLRSRVGSAAQRLGVRVRFGSTVENGRNTETILTVIDKPEDSDTE